MLADPSLDSSVRIANAAALDGVDTDAAEQALLATLADLNEPRPDLPSAVLKVPVRRRGTPAQRRGRTLDALALFDDDRARQSIARMVEGKDECMRRWARVAAGTQARVSGWRLLERGEWSAL